MSDDNLRHWSVLGKTDPKHTKPFQRVGGFKGTATKPIWTEYRLTEHFGPCGVGWGCDEPAFHLIAAGEEILVFCTVAGWYIDAGKRATVYGVGGDKVLVKRQSGPFTDDEAYKKAFTDALGNAFKHVGSGADVHMGLFEDSKYLAEVRREFADEEEAPAQSWNPSERQQPTARERIYKAIDEATLPSEIDAIIGANTEALARIKKAGPEIYEGLMGFANTRKMTMYAAA